MMTNEAANETPESSSRPSGGMPGTDPLESGLGRRSPIVDQAEVDRLHAKLTSRLLGIDDSAPRIGRFVLLERLGEGGMGVVYSAYDDRLNRRVAIKLLRAEIDGEAVHRRLVREAQAMAKLSHPNVATVYEVGEKSGRVFIAMELIKGQTLRRWRAEAKPRWREIVTIYVQAARGLAAAHSAGLIHRDFKPDNAILGRDGRVRVLDFGLVRSASTTDPLPAATVLPEPPDDALGDPLTRTGSMMGTPAYMAPEQFLGDPIDARTDQFAFCVALWEALYGERPFAGKSRTDLLGAVTRGRLSEIPRGTSVPRGVHDAIVRGLAGAPAERWPSMDALADRLARDPARPRRIAIALGGAVVAITLSAWTGGQMASDDRCDTVFGAFAQSWTPAREDLMTSAFAATGSPIATDAAERVASLLASDARAMADAAHASCLAHESGMQSAEGFDRRMACLERRRTAVATLVDRLARADAAIVEHAIDAVLALGPVERCMDDRVLADELAPPPELGEEVEAIRGRLAEADALTYLGRPDEALAIAAPALERAQAIDHDPLVAEAAVCAATAAAAGEDARAQGDFELALWAAQRSGHDVVVLEAARGLVGLADHGYRIDPMPWAKLAEATGERLGDATSRADGLSSLGQALARVHDWSAARDALERVVAYREQAQGLDAAALAFDLPHLARAAGSLGDTIAVENHLERALAIAEQTYGAHHPQIAGIALSAADAAGWSKQDVLALRYYDRGMDALVALNRTDTIQAAWILGGSAVVLARLGRGAEAVPRMRASIAIKERELGVDHMQVVTAVRNLAFMSIDTGDHATAEPLARRAITGIAALLGEDHAWVAVPRVALGEALLGLGRAEEGIGELAAALRGLGDDQAVHRARANAALERARALP